MNGIREVSRMSDANDTQPQQGAQESQEFVTLRLGNEEYGIDILCVQEIRSYESPTRIANAVPYIKGVINLRGVIVPILDLRIKFALESVEYNESTVVIVLNVRSRTVGIVVDSVSDVLALSPADRRPAPALGAAIDTGFITDIGSVAGEDGERMLILLDIERLIATADIGLFA
ncbi:chemotaxis protein CheW [Burkholderia glumae]|uniref:chemotaxis protein CheW n=1 Tax=Burkholderia glumae TaxID=337 RepID=UPI00036C0F12|nr:chemotaxis protein CheW [Burkholderia glumae]MCM2494781.1 chemotaxis protein CheW [Burkholderia glumae]MCM2545646.1 chemotaxis protein CheW [Burkholderia glumae]PJO20384.1 chemotaxis protein CheW [Burkholderia glumae AU6208]QHE13865.1 chemotaxis protein CheW [Burkholderia glumae AU6208]